MRTLDPQTAAGLLRTMWRIRCFEERVAALKRTLQVHGLIHLSVGGEGAPAAVCAQLRDEDVVYSGHRAHGHAIAKGAPTERVMAELMGRVDGLCRGLGGSMHLVDRDRGFFGATGVVGGNLPLALGNALAARVRAGDEVTVVFFGDGAVQAGHFHESVNLAALWRLPVIFVCENNGVAEFTSRSEHTTVELVSDVVAPYGLQRETVAGSDVPAIFEAFGAFLERARAGNGPFLLECLTHRRRGHYEGDPERYRDPVAEEEWRRRDPVARLQAHAIENGWLDPGSAGAIEREAQAEIERAVRFARESPYPEPGAAEPFVYALAVGCPEKGPHTGPYLGHPSATGARPHGGAGPPESEVTFVRAINDALARAMRADERVIVIGEDVAEGGPYMATAGLADEFGRDRVLNTPISEGAVCGVAIGAAQAGLRPVVEIMFIDFITLALDQLVNQAAKAHFMSGGQLSVPMVLRTTCGAGSRSGAQHSQSLEAWVAHVPGLKVVMPSSAADAAGLLASAIADPNPVVFVENRALYFRREQLPEAPERLQLGRAHTLRFGADITIVATSRLVGDALEAADRLAAGGVQAEVIDPRTLLPLDLETIAGSVRRTGRAVVAHEAVTLGGFGAELAAQIQDAALDRLEAPIQRVGAPFTPVPVSPPLEDAYRPGAGEIYAAARSAIEWDWPEGKEPPLTTAGGRDFRS
ncbi:MAG: dehydrogenase E1 component subunit alpha/beta [Solirubrobacterales bacterium]|nr:dehydrogenase E1 component subunit alpha/beta [Solirubrobacterales bacterium]